MTSATANQAPPAAHEDTFTVQELAARWKASIESILEAIHEKRLIAFKLGKRKWRVSLSEVLRFESSGGVAPATAPATESST